MSNLTRFLEGRINELKSEIESQQQQLAAYKHVLEIEMRSNGSADSPAAPAAEPSQSDIGGVSFSGNKTTFVIDIVRSCASRGASAKEVDSAFSTRGIPTGTNFIYSTLSALVAKKRLARRDGRYFAVKTS